MAQHPQPALFFSKHVGIAAGGASVEDFSDLEVRNMHTVREFMVLSYDPQKACAQAVAHLVAEGATFEAHTTFPEVHDPAAYAQAHRGASDGLTRDADD